MAIQETGGVPDANHILAYGFKQDIVEELKAISDENFVSIPIDEGKGCKGVVGRYIDLTSFQLHNWDANYCDKEEYQRVLSYSSQIDECYSRHFVHNQIRYPKPQDLSAIKRSHYAYMKRILTEVNINKIIFSNIPHEGFDNILYALGISSGVEMLACYQLPTANRFQLLRLSERLEESFSDQVVNTDSTSELSQKDIYTIRSYADQVTGKRRFFYMHRPQKSKIRRVLEIPKRIVQKLRSTSQTKALSRLPFRLVESAAIKVRERAFRQRLGQHQRRIEDPEDMGDYIYYPLHLQPELTTSALGSIYCDQTIAIAEASRLAKQLDCRVICKENPLQRSSHRSKDIFNAIGSLGNVYLVSKDMDSLSLIKNSRMVVTITGTAGLEALAAGVPVWCLGDIWWKNFHNVYHTFESAVKRLTDYGSDKSKSGENSFSNRDALLKELTACTRNAFRGCTDLDYADDLDIEASLNSKVVARSLENGLSYSRYTQ